MNWYFRAFQKFADFKGRASRKEYWMFVLINTVICVILSLLTKQLDYGYKLMGVYGLFIIVPCWALSVRRLHDIGRNGWFLLLGLIPIIGPLMVLFFKAKRGNPYSNRYGAIPFI